MIEHLKTYKCRIKIRQDIGLELKPFWENIDEKVMDLQAYWPIEDDDSRYPGEWAMYSKDLYDLAGIAWIASGDVEIIE